MDLRNGINLELGIVRNEEFCSSYWNDKIKQGDVPEHAARERKIRYSIVVGRKT